MSIQISLFQTNKKKLFFFYIEQNYFFSAGLLGSFKISLKSMVPFFFFIDKFCIHISVPLLYLSFYNQIKGNTNQSLMKKFLYKKLRFNSVYFTNSISQLIYASSEGFRNELKIMGVGYRFLTHLNLVVLKLGYSHLVIYLVPYALNIYKKGKTSLIIFGSKHNLLSEIGMFIRLFRIPNVYTGKGIRFKKEILILKQGKVNQV